MEWAAYVSSMIVSTRRELLTRLDEATEDEAVPVLVGHLGKLRADDLSEDVEIEPCRAIKELVTYPKALGATTQFPVPLSDTALRHCRRRLARYSSL